MTTDSVGNPIYATQPRDSTYTLLLRGSGGQMARSDKLSGNEVGNLRQRRLSLEPLIQEIAARHQLDPALIRAIVHVESRFAINAISPRGASGLMQLMPDTAKRYGSFNRNDPARNLDAGARYFKDLLARYEGNIALALSAYNAGEGSVDRHSKKVPPYRETMLYVPEVLTKYEAYKRAEGSGAQQ